MRLFLSATVVVLVLLGVVIAAQNVTGSIAGILYCIACGVSCVTDCVSGIGHDVTDTVLCIADNVAAVV